MDKTKHSDLPMKPSEMPQLGLQALLRAAEKVHAREAEEAEKLANATKKAKVS
jgi:hypothetical protein